MRDVVLAAATDLQGILRGYDQATNILLQECQERVYSTKVSLWGGVSLSQKALIVNALCPNLEVHKSRYCKVQQVHAAAQCCTARLMMSRLHSARSFPIICFPIKRPAFTTSTGLVGSTCIHLHALLCLDGEVRQVWKFPKSAYGDYGCRLSTSNRNRVLWQYVLFAVALAWSATTGRVGVPMVRNGEKLACVMILPARLWKSGKQNGLRKWSGSSFYNPLP